MSRLLCVCLGNICRSPAAEAVLRRKAAEAGHQVHVASAGVGGWHVGAAPDARMQAAARRRGYDLAGQRARQVALSDFYEFDLLLAMDRSNLAALQEMAPHNAEADLRLFLSFADGLDVDETPDPYYGGAAGFEQVLDLVEAGADGLLRYLARSSGNEASTS